VRQLTGTPKSRASCLEGGNFEVMALVVLSWSWRFWLWVDFLSLDQ